MFDGIGYKIGMFVNAISTVLAGFVLAFLYQWKLTLVLISVTPLLVVAGGILGKVTSSIILFKEPISKARNLSNTYSRCNIHEYSKPTLFLIERGIRYVMLSC